MNKRKAASELAFRRARVVREVFVFPSSGSYPICPQCGATLEWEYQSFCDRCGQKLDWSQYDQAVEVQAAHM